MENQADFKADPSSHIRLHNCYLPLLQLSLSGFNQV